jgi:hypothetical protein
MFIINSIKYHYLFQRITFVVVSNVLLNGLIILLLTSLTEVDGPNTMMLMRVIWFMALGGVKRAVLQRVKACILRIGSFIGFLDMLIASTAATYLPIG